VARYAAVSTALAVVGDLRLSELLEAAPVVSVGIGGTAVRLDVEGVPVFAKHVPLTDLERRPENLRSTANLFGLPVFCHYGLGSAGGGVWRELAAHIMTTNWVLGNRAHAFPLLYHWRVLPSPKWDAAEDRERSIAFWGGSRQVRERLDQLDNATASVVLCCEFFPYALHDWLNEQVARGDVEAACAMVEPELLDTAAFLRENGLLHFDAHFGNIMTDGRRLYFGDFGLATSSRFELSRAESDFIALNATHDERYVETQLVNWLVTALAEPERADRSAFIERVAAGEKPGELPKAVWDVVERHAPVAAIMNDFYGKLYLEDRATPYPAEALRRVVSGN